MKKIIFSILVISVFTSGFAQITILEDDIQEKIITKPEPFDSLSDIVYQKNPLQYKKYIGLKLFLMPISNKYKEDVYFLNEKMRFYSLHKSFVTKRHNPFDKSDLAFLYLGGCSSKKELLEKANNKKNYKQILETFLIAEENYENSFKDSTNVYLPQETRHHGIFCTPYEKIQNTYFTILDVKMIKDRTFTSYYEPKLSDLITLEEWDNENHGYACFFLRNETTQDSLFWYAGRLDIDDNFTLVPYFEKKVSTYKNKDIIATTFLSDLTDINTGERVSINPGDKWHCYEVTFLHTKESCLVRPFILIENGKNTIKIPFNNLDKKYHSNLTTVNLDYTSLFIMADEYDRLLAEKQKSEKEKLAAQAERKRQQELANQKRKEQIQKKWGPKYGSLIANGKICLSMTKEMCIDAWGHPYSINTTIVKGLTHEQWVYGLGTYVYFDNGIITAIQN